MMTLSMTSRDPERSIFKCIISNTASDTDSVTMGHIQEIKNNKYKIVKKTVVYHLVNGCTVLLHIENSKNDRLKVTLLCSTLTFSQTATSNITFNIIVCWFQCVTPYSR